MKTGRTADRPWIEAVTGRGSGFKGRTFSRIHIAGDGISVPTVGEIWASADHEADSHAHGNPEILYVLRGEAEVGGEKLRPGDAVFIPAGSSYNARVTSPGGCHLLRVELPGGGGIDRDAGYDPRVWKGKLTAEGWPDLREEP